MSETVIKVERLSKRYRLGTIGGKTLREDMSRWWAKLRGKPDPLLTIDQLEKLQAQNSSPPVYPACPVGRHDRTGVESLPNGIRSPFHRGESYSTRAPRSMPPASSSSPPAPCSMQPSKDGFIWALRDINFEVKQGEILGIIGANGAGKSTLLKILTRITAPTKGRALMEGRVGALLEVGTGFHPELTGRENIFLSGAILGMTKAEVQSKLDEIIDFSGCERYIDTPIKRYSSGMNVRLAFAVAAHLEPEILLIDEVLAVGDAQFQKKCLGKMREVGEGGRTVLFVSHNMQAIRNLCYRTILLNNGEVVSDAATLKSLDRYNQLLRDIKIDAETGIDNELTRRGGGTIRFTSIAVQDMHGKNRYNFKMGDTIRFKISYKVFEDFNGVSVGFSLRSGMTREVVTSVNHVLTSEKTKAGTTGTVTIELPETYIRPGEYPLYLHVSEAFRKKKSNIDILDDLTSPLVISTDNNKQYSDFNPSIPTGYFSVPSRIIKNEINE